MEPSVAPQTLRREVRRKWADEHEEDPVAGVYVMVLEAARGRSGEDQHDKRFSPHERKRWADSDPKAWNQWAPNSAVTPKPEARRIVREVPERTSNPNLAELRGWFGFGRGVANLQPEPKGQQHLFITLGMVNRINLVSGSRRDFADSHDNLQKEALPVRVSPSRAPKSKQHAK